LRIASAWIEILRDNMPFGDMGKGEFGTYFIGYARSPHRIGVTRPQSMQSSRLRTLASIYYSGSVLFLIRSPDRLARAATVGS